MPTVMTHAVAGLGLGRVFTVRRLPLLFWELVVILPMVPDADVLAFKFGIPYADMLGHRGLSHSLVFAAGLGLVVAVLTYRRFGFRLWDLWGFFFLLIASHGILDGFTNGGLGVAYFAPLDNRRYFFPWRPIEVSPIGLSFLSMDGLGTLASEALWVWLPVAVAVGAVEAVRRRRRESAVDGNEKAQM